MPRSTRGTILLVEDPVGLDRGRLQDWLAHHLLPSAPDLCLDVRVVESLDAAREALREEAFPVVISQAFLRFQAGDVVTASLMRGQVQDLLAWAKRECPRTTFIIFRRSASSSETIAALYSEVGNVACGIPAHVSKEAQRRAAAAIRRALREA